MKKNDTQNQTALAEKQPITAISVRCAMSIFYYLMWADGQTTEDEFEKFDEIGNALDPAFKANRPEIIRNCYAQVKKTIDPEDRYDVLLDGILDALHTSAPTQDSYMTPKHFLWNLLTVAYCDGECAPEERRLIKAIVRNMDVDKAIFLEMESSLLTLLDLEKELAWIKTTNRPYIVIEAMVNEIADRKDFIMQGVKALITL